MISIIIPTYNESENILFLIDQLTAELKNSEIRDYELIIVDDDSQDHTVELVENLKLDHVKIINRKGKQRDLAHSVMEGFAIAKGDILGMMDADLSHPPSMVPLLVQILDRGANLAVGSRYVKGGGVKNWSFIRRLASKLACFFARPLTLVKDVSSGFLFFKRQVIENVSLKPFGFKIGLEIFVKGKHEGKIVEVPYIFIDRKRGKSKFCSGIILLYFRHLFHLCFFKLKKKA